MAKVEIEDHSKEFLSAMRQQVLLGLETIGQEAEGYAKSDCPVDTGRLRNSIAHKVIDDENSVYIGTNVEYGVYVEFREATHKTGKAHFLRDAATTHSDHYQAILKAALKA